MRYVRSRASLLILGVFFLITRFFYPNFDHASKNSRLYHEGIQSPHHLPFACDFKFIQVEMHYRKLNYAFKLIVNPSLHLECTMLFDIHPRRWLTEVCLRLLATKWLCRVFALEAFIITAARIQLRQNVIEITFLQRWRTLRDYKEEATWRNLSI